MTRPTKNTGIGRLLCREAKAALKLAPWIAVSILLVAALLRPDPAATGGLFQSPQETPTPTLTLTPTSTPTAETEPSTPGTPAATATSIPETTATATTEAPGPTVVPSETTQPLPSPTQVTSTPTVAPVPTTPAPPTETSLPSVSPTPDSERYPEGESNLRFEWGMLFDSVALGLSYIWLCCGALVLLGIPLLFLLLWVASKRQRQQRE